jgi:tetratricopeptide (TPR) repeat protein
VISALSWLVCLELLAAVILCGLRLNSTRPSPPPVETYSDAITGAELLALPGSFLFDSSLKWSVLGETYLKSGFLHQATACLARAAEMDPASAEIALMHGYCLGRIGKLDTAQTEFRRAAQHGEHPVSQMAWYFLGRALLQKEQPEEAEKSFVGAGDDHLPSVFQRVKILLRTGRTAEAAPLLQRLVEALPGEVRVWQLTRQFAEGTGGPVVDASDAAERARSLLSIHQLPPSLFAVQEDIGMAREFNQALQLQAAGDAKNAARRMLQLARDETRWQNSNPWLLQTVAAVHLEAGDTATARRLLDRQIAKDGFLTAQAWNLLGDVEFLDHHPVQAGEFWRRSGFMNPALLDFDKLKAIAEQAGDRKLARKYEGTGRCYAGVQAFRNGNSEDARSNLLEAARLAPDLPAAWFYLGETERLLGNVTAAAEAYRECIALKPSHGRAHEKLDQFNNRGR